MNIKTQFSIYVVNKPGVLAGITSAIADAGVNLTALRLDDSGENGVLRIVCDKPDVARKVLTDEHDRWTETEVLELDMANTPGGFAATSKKLADAGVNVSYVYATSDQDAKSVAAIYKVDDLEKAKAALG